jgi:hypothetical protein
VEGTHDESAPNLAKRIPNSAVPSYSEYMQYSTECIDGSQSDGYAGLFARTSALACMPVVGPTAIYKMAARTVFASPTESRVPWHHRFSSFPRDVACD